MMVPVPPFVVPTKAFHLDFSVAQGLWIGSFLSNGRGKKVVGDDLLFMGRGSDAGLFIPHISFPPTWMNIMTTLFGSSMILFGTSSVTLACKNAIWGNEDCDLAATPFGPVPFSLNLACHDPYSAPTDLVVVWGSVYTGMSFADLLAALIDFAINLACEVGMKYVAEPLAKKAGNGMKQLGGQMSSAWKKAFPKATAAAAKRRAAKGASKGVFSSMVSSISKLAGYQSTDAVKSYTKKAATTRGMYNALKELSYTTGKNLDSELIDLVNAGTPGVFSKEFLSELQNINSSKYDDYVEKMLKSSKSSLDKAEDAGEKEIKRAFKDEFIDNIDYDDVITYKSIMNDAIAVDSVMRTTFFKAMKEMSDAAEKAASTELARSLGYVALKKSVTKILWKNTLRNGGLIQIDENVLGYQLQYDSSPTLQFSEKWWANQEWFGEEIYSASDLGLTTTDDSEYWDDAYVEGDGTDDDDYWYADSTAISESVTSEETQDADDDDYWYGDDDADAAE